MDYQVSQTLIKDPNIIGLVKKYLKVGVLDNGELMVNEEGSAQGNIISPILANIYMHNVLILSILVDTFISKISFPMQPGPEIGSISDA